MHYIMDLKCQICNLDDERVLAFIYLKIKNIYEIKLTILKLLF